jgi:hypothetical protein
MRAGCLVVLLAVLLVVSGAMLLERLDTSDGVHDPHLEQRLRDVLGCVTHETDPDPSDSHPWHELTADLSDEHFRRRVLAAEGWEQLVVLAPHASGKSVSAHPAFTSWWLRRRLGDEAGATSDTTWRIIAIRDQAVVGSFSFESKARFLTTVITRGP